MWTIEDEKRFFQEALRAFATPEQLFYKLDNEYFAYIPKTNRNTEVNQVVQSRNSLIGNFTEKWCKEKLHQAARECNLFAVNGVVCEQLSLTKQSPADLAFCVTDTNIQRPENIKVIFETKMSIVNNYKYRANSIEYLGDYTSHKGNPSLLRSDSMLKAIGKSINIRLSGTESRKIPIIIIGNSPITRHYERKVDLLRRSGVIQSFVSVYKNPTTEQHIQRTPNGGFRTFGTMEAFKDYLRLILSSDSFYFSSMLPKERIGLIISEANLETENEAKANKFLELIEREYNEQERN